MWVYLWALSDDESISKYTARRPSSRLHAGMGYTFTVQQDLRELFSRTRRMIWCDHWFFWFFLRAAENFRPRRVCGDGEDRTDKMSTITIHNCAPLRRRLINLSAYTGSIIASSCVQKPVAHIRNRPLFDNPFVRRRPGGTYCRQSPEAFAARESVLLLLL